jgi:transcriptional regulator with XRE-family HTH domain
MYRMRYSLAESIREARRRSGMSQEALAKASGASRITIARLESGSTQDFRLGTLQRLCGALGLELTALPPGARPADPAPAKPIPATRKDMQLRQLDARRRHAALAAALLAVNPEDAADMVRQALASVALWEQEGQHSEIHSTRWRARLEGSVRTVALRLLEHNAETDALLANSPWTFALEPEAK